MLFAVSSTNGEIELAFLGSMNPYEERVSVWSSVENPKLFLCPEGLAFRKKTRTVMEKRWRMIIDQ